MFHCSMDGEMLSPSKYHANRKWRNWPIYDTCDPFLIVFHDLYKGSIYDLGADSGTYEYIQICLIDIKRLPILTQTYSFCVV